MCVLTVVCAGVKDPVSYRDLMVKAEVLMDGIMDHSIAPSAINMEILCYVLAHLREKHRWSPLKYIQSNPTIIRRIDRSNYAPYQVKSNVLALLKNRGHYQNPPDVTLTDIEEKADKTQVLTELHSISNMQIPSASVANNLFHSLVRVKLKYNWTPINWLKKNWGVLEKIKHSGASSKVEKQMLDLLKHGKLPSDPVIVETSLREQAEDVMKHLYAIVDHPDDVKSQQITTLLDEMEKLKKEFGWNAHRWFLDHPEIKDVLQTYGLVKPAVRRDFLKTMKTHINRHKHRKLQKKNRRRFKTKAPIKFADEDLISNDNDRLKNIAPDARLRYILSKPAFLSYMNTPTVMKAYKRSTPQVLKQRRAVELTPQDRALIDKVLQKHDSSLKNYTGSEAMDLYNAFRKMYIKYGWRAKNDLEQKYPKLYEKIKDSPPSKFKEILLNLIDPKVYDNADPDSTNDALKAEIKELDKLLEKLDAQITPLTTADVNTLFSNLYNMDHKYKWGLDSDYEKKYPNLFARLKDDDYHEGLKRGLFTLINRYEDINKEKKKEQSQKILRYPKGNTIEEDVRETKHRGVPKTTQACKTAQKECQQSQKAAHKTTQKTAHKSEAIRRVVGQPKWMSQRVMPKRGVVVDKTAQKATQRTQKSGQKATQKSTHKTVHKPEAIHKVLGQPEWMHKAKLPKRALPENRRTQTPMNKSQNPAQKVSHKTAHKSEARRVVGQPEQISRRTMVDRGMGEDKTIQKATQKARKAEQRTAKRASQKRAHKSESISRVVGQPKWMAQRKMLKRGMAEDRATQKVTRKTQKADKKITRKSTQKRAQIARAVKRVVGQPKWMTQRKMPKRGLAEAILSRIKAGDDVNSKPETKTQKLAAEPEMNTERVISAPNAKTQKPETDKQKLVSDSQLKTHKVVSKPKINIQKVASIPEPANVKEDMELETEEEVSKPETIAPKGVSQPKTITQEVSKSKRLPGKLSSKLGAKTQDMLAHVEAESQDKLAQLEGVQDVKSMRKKISKQLVTEPKGKVSKHASKHSVQKDEISKPQGTQKVISKPGTIQKLVSDNEASEEETVAQKVSKPEKTQKSMSKTETKANRKKLSLPESMKEKQTSTHEAIKQKSNKKQATKQNEPSVKQKSVSKLAQENTAVSKDSVKHPDHPMNTLYKRTRGMLARRRKKISKKKVKRILRYLKLLHDRAGVDVGQLLDEFPKAKQKILKKVKSSKLGTQLKLIKSKAPSKILPTKTKLPSDKHDKKPKVSYADLERIDGIFKALAKQIPFNDKMAKELYYQLELMYDKYGWRAKNYLELRYKKLYDRIKKSRIDPKMKSKLLGAIDPSSAAEASSKTKTMSHKLKTSKSKTVSSAKPKATSSAKLTTKLTKSRALLTPVQTIKSTNLKSASSTKPTSNSAEPKSKTLTAEIKTLQSMLEALDNKKSHLSTENVKVLYDKLKTMNDQYQWGIGNDLEKDFPNLYKHLRTGKYNTDLKKKLFNLLTLSEQPKRKSDAKTTKTESKSSVMKTDSAKPDDSEVKTLSEKDKELLKKFLERSLTNMKSGTTKVTTKAATYLLSTVRELRDKNGLNFMPLFLKYPDVFHAIQEAVKGTATEKVLTELTETRLRHKRSIEMAKRYRSAVPDSIVLSKRYRRPATQKKKFHKVMFDSTRKKRYSRAEEDSVVQKKQFLDLGLYPVGKTQNHRSSTSPLPIEKRFNRAVPDPSVLKKKYRRSVKSSRAMKMRSRRALPNLAAEKSKKSMVEVLETIKAGKVKLDADYLERLLSALSIMKREYDWSPTAWFKNNMATFNMILHACTDSKMKTAFTDYVDDSDMRYKRRTARQRSRKPSQRSKKPRRRGKIVDDRWVKVKNKKRKLSVKKKTVQRPSSKIRSQRRKKLAGKRKKKYGSKSKTKLGRKKIVKPQNRRRPVSRRRKTPRKILKARSRKGSVTKPKVIKTKEGKVVSRTLKMLSPKSSSSAQSQTEITSKQVLPKTPQRKKQRKFPRKYKPRSRKVQAPQKSRKRSSRKRRRKIRNKLKKPKVVKDKITQTVQKTEKGGKEIVKKTSKEKIDGKTPQTMTKKETVIKPKTRGGKGEKQTVVTKTLVKPNAKGKKKTKTSKSKRKKSLKKTKTGGRKKRKKVVPRRKSKISIGRKKKKSWRRTKKVRGSKKISSKKTKSGVKRKRKSSKKAKKSQRKLTKTKLSKGMKSKLNNVKQRLTKVNKKMTKKIKLKTSRTSASKEAKTKKRKGTKSKGIGRKKSSRRRKVKTLRKRKGKTSKKQKTKGKGKPSKKKRKGKKLTKRKGKILKLLKKRGRSKKLKKRKYKKLKKKTKSKKLLTSKGQKRKRKGKMRSKGKGKKLKKKKDRGKRLRKKTKSIKKRRKGNGRKRKPKAKKLKKKGKGKKLRKKKGRKGKERKLKRKVKGTKLRKKKRKNKKPRKGKGGKKKHKGKKLRKKRKGKKHRKKKGKGQRLRKKGKGRAKKKKLKKGKGRKRKLKGKKLKKKKGKKRVRKGKGMKKKGKKIKKKKRKGKKLRKRKMKKGKGKKLRKRGKNRAKKKRKSKKLKGRGQKNRRSKLRKGKGRKQKGKRLGKKERKRKGQKNRRRGKKMKKGKRRTKKLGKRKKGKRLRKVKHRRKKGKGKKLRKRKSQKKKGKGKKVRKKGKFRAKKRRKSKKLKKGRGRKNRRKLRKEKGRKRKGKRLRKKKGRKNKRRGKKMRKGKRRDKKLGKRKKKGKKLRKGKNRRQKRKGKKLRKRKSRKKKGKNRAKKTRKSKKLKKGRGQKNRRSKLRKGKSRKRKGKRLGKKERKRKRQKNRRGKKMRKGKRRTKRLGKRKKKGKKLRKGKNRRKKGKSKKRKKKGKRKKHQGKKIKGKKDLKLGYLMAAIPSKKKKKAPVPCSAVKKNQNRWHNKCIVWGRACKEKNTQLCAHRNKQCVEWRKRVLSCTQKQKLAAREAKLSEKMSKAKMQFQLQLPADLQIKCRVSKHQKINRNQECEKWRKTCTQSKQPQQDEKCMTQRSRCQAWHVTLKECYSHWLTKCKVMSQMKTGKGYACSGTKKMCVKRDKNHVCIKRRNKCKASNTYEVLKKCNSILKGWSMPVWADNFAAWWPEHATGWSRTKTPGLAPGSSSVSAPKPSYSGYSLGSEDCTQPEAACYICKPNPIECINGGHCVSTSDGKPICKCPGNFAGPKCQYTAAPCPADQHPCKNGGTCLSIHAEEFVKCACQPGWTGMLCDTKAQPCASQPCLNNGKCKETGPDTYHCDCTPSSRGQRCQIRLNPCMSNPCQNYGVCTSDTNNMKFECKCKPGFEGPRCQGKLDPCKNNPCQGNGKCIANGLYYKCECINGRSGLHCEILPNPCAKNPCLHGGKCRPDKNGEGYHCDCLYNWHGIKCEKSITISINISSGTIDPCDKNPCPKRKRCISNGDRYKCLKLSEYANLKPGMKPGIKPVKKPGQKSHKKSAACRSPHKCGKHGKCIPRGKLMYHCQCHVGWTGTHCEVKQVEFQDPCDRKPCRNGATCRGRASEYWLVKQYSVASSKYMYHTVQVQYCHYIM